MARNPRIDSEGNIVSDTGKKLNPDDFTVLLVPKTKKKLKEKDWMMFYQAGLAKLAKDKELRGAPRSVLDYLMSMMDFENFIGVDQTRIANELAMEKASVSKAIKLLLEKKILEKGPKFGRMNSYKLNDFYAWRGTVESKHQSKILSMADARKKKADHISP
jgi:hypothetical protein